MPFNDDDAAALMNDAEVLRRQVKGLQAALVAARAETLAAVHLGDPDFGPAFVGSLAATVTADGRASVGVVICWHLRQPLTCPATLMPRLPPIV